MSQAWEFGDLHTREANEEWVKATDSLGETQRLLYTVAMYVLPIVALAAFAVVAYIGVKRVMAVVATKPARVPVAGGFATDGEQSDDDDEYAHETYTQPAKKRSRDAAK